MRTLYEIRKDIDVLLDEAETVIMAESEATRSITRRTLALAMLLSLRRKVKQQFINIKQYMRI